MLASVLVSVALESLRGKSGTLESDDHYEGFATFLYLQKDVTAKRTCRKTCEFRLNAVCELRSIFDGWQLRSETILAPFSLQNRPGGHENDVGRAPERAEGVSGASRGRLGSSGAAFWRAHGKKYYVTVTVGETCGAAGSLRLRLLHASDSLQDSCTRSDTPCPGGGGLKCYAHPAGPLVP